MKYVLNMSFQFSKINYFEFQSLTTLSDTRNWLLKICPNQKNVSQVTIHYQCYKVALLTRYLQYFHHFLIRYC